MFISKFRERKGITLIALVITIIVLLILAGVTIAMVVGDNGILTRSREAKDTTNIKKIQEEVDLEAADLVAEYHTKDNGEVPSTAGEYVAVQINEKTVNGIEIEADESTMKITASKDGITVEGIIQSDGHIDWDDANSTVAGGGSGTGSGESTGGETGGGSETTNEPRDTAIESTLATRLASSIESDYIINVSYSPSGTYTWDKTLATSSDTGTTELSSASGTYAITNWRVLDLDQTTGIVRLVPTAPVGSLYLQGAQGYNNAVKLLDDACNGLYKDDDKGITAQSIKEEDFVKAGGDAWTTARGNYSSSFGAYGNQYSSPYTNRYYPAIYALEQNAVIDGDTKTGLTQSQQNDTIGKTTDGMTDGYKQATTNIQPYQTYYKTTDYNTTSGLLGAKYSKLLQPSTEYWVASRCVNLRSSDCVFCVRYVYSGCLGGLGMLDSSSRAYGSLRPLFPVVSLSSGHLTANATGNGYTVE